MERVERGERNAKKHFEFFKGKKATFGVRKGSRPYL